MQGAFQRLVRTRRKRDLLRYIIGNASALHNLRANPIERDIDQSHADVAEQGARLDAPQPGLKRGLAWANAFAARLREAEVLAYDAGLPT